MTKKKDGLPFIKPKSDYTNRIVKLILLVLLNIQFSNAQIIDEIKYIAFSLGNFSTLSRLKNELKDVRIIGLGESNHSMGTTFEAKVAMIKYLHDSLGFNTIAFESGMYDCQVTNKLIKEDRCDLENFYKSLFSIWKCHEVDSLFTFIKNANHSDNPLNFIGIDNQFLGHAKEMLAKDYKLLEDSLHNYDNSFVLSSRFYNLLEDEIKYSNYFKKFSIEDTTLFCKNISNVNRIIEINNLSENEYYSNWVKINSNLRTDFIRRFYPFGSIRDSMMAENLINYMNSNPSEKVIIWAASYHLMYDANNIELDFYKDIIVAGDKLRDEYGKDYYFIAFTPYCGNFGAEKGLFSFKMRTSTKNSIEHYIKNSFNCNFGIYSFREKQNISNEISTARILGTKEQEMNIYKVCDAIFYIRNMKGVKYYKK